MIYLNRDFSQYYKSMLQTVLNDKVGILFDGIDLRSANIHAWLEGGGASANHK